MSSRITILPALLLAIVLVGCGVSTQAAQVPTTQTPVTAETSASESSATWDLPIASVR